MRGRSWLLAVCVAASICVLVPAADASVPHTCDEYSWTGGTSEWCNGVLTYRDYVYDDTGANTEGGSFGGANPIGGSPHGSGLTRATGDVLHTDHGQSLNSADLLVLRVRRDSNVLRVTFHLNTLFPSDTTLAALAIDTDNNRATGGGRWSEHIDISSDGWDVAHVFHHRDPARNTIDGTIPVPAGSHWRLQAVVALGDGTPMNVAFRPRETGAWWEAQQSAALATGDISRFGQTIAVADLGSTKTSHTKVPGPGLWERVYASKFPLEEGVNYDGKSYAGVRGVYHYLGIHQPYALYVPKPDPSGVYGVQLTLHGSTASHGSVVGGDGFQYAFGDYLRELGDHPRLVLSPLGRGPNNGYVDYGERDVLDAMGDVFTHFDVDRDRVFASGYSMGGAGTYWLTSFRPDLFAGAVNWVGHTNDCFTGTPLQQGRFRPEFSEQFFPNGPENACVGNGGNNYDYLEGTRHVPMGMLYAAEDELVWVTQALGLMERYRQLGYEHKMWLHPVAEHLTFAIVDSWMKEARWTAGRTRVKNPARISFRTNTYFWHDPAHIRHDNVYWIKNLRPSKPDYHTRGDMVVELTSHRCAPGRETLTDLSFDAGIDPLPWVSQEARPRPGAAIPQANRISGTLANIKEITIDPAGACMRPGPIALDIATSAPVTVHFADGRPDVKLSP